MKQSHLPASRIIELSNNGISDSLTGAPAPKIFFDNLAREISKSKRKFEAISIITVKILSAEISNISKSEKKVIDFEKDLVKVNQIIKSNLRSGDFYSRIAENGFWICIQGDAIDAGKACLRLGSKISQSPAFLSYPEKINFLTFEWNISQDFNALIHELDLAYFS